MGESPFRFVERVAGPKDLLESASARNAADRDHTIWHDLARRVARIARARESIYLA
jgi:hypothetical protein